LPISLFSSPDFGAPTISHQDVIQPHKTLSPEPGDELTRAVPSRPGETPTATDETAPW
jgi:hypothetical protein